MKKRGKPRYEEKAIEEKTSLHSKDVIIMFFRALDFITKPPFFQSMILSITKAEISCTHLMTLELICVLMLRLTNVSSLKNKFMPGRDTTKELLKFGGSLRRLIFFFRAAWMGESRWFLSFIYFI